MVNKRRFAIVGILGIALLFRLLALFFSSKNVYFHRYIMGGDAVGYIQLAHNIVSYGFFGFNPENPTAFRMPGYPIILAVFY